MSGERIRLLEHVAYQHFGSAVGEVISILLHRRTLPASQLIRLSALPPKTVHSALLISSLHSILYHSIESSNGRDQEFFEVDEQALGERMRGGRWRVLVGRTGGVEGPPEHEYEDEKPLVKAKAKAAVPVEPVSKRKKTGGGALSEEEQVWEWRGVVVEGLWREGMRSAEEMKREVAAAMWAVESRKRARESKRPKDENGMEGKGKGKEKAEEVQPRRKRPRERMAGDPVLPARKWIDEFDAEPAAEKLILDLLKDRFIGVVTIGSKSSKQTMMMKWEDELKNSMAGIPTAKELKDIKVKMNTRWDDWTEEQTKRAEGQIIPEESGQGKKKKKRKTYVYASDDDEDATETIKLPEGAFYQLNHARFHIRWRNQIMREFAKDCFNEEVAIVFGVILDLVEPSLRTLDQDTQLQHVTSSSVLAAISRLDPVPDLSQCFGDRPKGANSKWTVPIPTDTAGVIQQIMLLLADRGKEIFGNASVRGLERQFLTEYTEKGGGGGGGGGGGKWVPDFEELGATIRRKTVEVLIRDQLDSGALKCWKILEEKGKLDEKHLARLAFLSVKDAREVIARLSSHNFIEPQEVSRSADRAPSRTFFLWFVDYSRVITSLLSHHYKALANLQVQRAKVLQDNAALLIKSDKTDSSGCKIPLTVKEQDQKALMKDVLLALATAEARIDRDVFILSELDPKA